MTSAATLQGMMPAAVTGGAAAAADHAASRTCCYTSFTFAYLSRARILCETLRSVHPDWLICAVLVDRPPPGVPADILLQHFDMVMLPEDLGIERVWSWLFKHDIVEACTAVKGHALLRLLEMGYNRVVYLDPDIAVFHPLDRVEERLETASVVLTPHQVEPNHSRMAVRDNEITSMQYGIFNLGFVAVRNDTEGRRFAAWWAEQLYWACYDDVAHGIFTDQKYCDLVPGLFDRVCIDRDSGMNVASWNLSRRRIAIERDGGIKVNGQPLRFFHFSKISSEGDVMVERYGGGNIEVFELWQWYKREVMAAQPAGITKGWWAYGRFSNGVPIQRAVRLLYRGRDDLMRAFTDPYDVTDGFYQWLRAEAPSLVEDPLDA